MGSSSDPEESRNSLFIHRLRMAVQEMKPSDDKLVNLAMVMEAADQLMQQEEKEEEAAAKAKQRRGNRCVNRADWDADYSPTAIAAAPKRKRHNGGERCGGVSPEHGKKKAKTDNGPHQSHPTPPLPQEFIERIHKSANGRNISEPLLVIQKGLYKTDVSEGHNRFSIPFNQIDQSFLTEEERGFLGRKNEATNSCNCIQVPLVEPCKGRESSDSCSVKLCRWDMDKCNGGRTSSSYVLNGEWKWIVKRNGLKAGSVVQLWAFRVDHELRFALVKLNSNPN